MAAYDRRRVRPIQKTCRLFHRALALRGHLAFSCFGSRSYSYLRDPGRTNPLPSPTSDAARHRAGRTAPRSLYPNSRLLLLRRLFVLSKRRNCLGQCRFSWPLRHPDGQRSGRGTRYTHGTPGNRPSAQPWRLLVESLGAQSSRGARGCNASCGRQNHSTPR